jgi:hypothetical protein
MPVLLHLNISCGVYILFSFSIRPSSELSCEEERLLILSPPNLSAIKAPPEDSGARCDACGRCGGGRIPGSGSSPAHICICRTENNARREK